MLLRCLYLLCWQIFFEEIVGMVPMWNHKTLLILTNHSLCCKSMIMFISMMLLFRFILFMSVLIIFWNFYSAMTMQMLLRCLYLLCWQIFFKEIVGMVPMWNYKTLLIFSNHTLSCKAMIMFFSMMLMFHFILFMSVLIIFWNFCSAMTMQMLLRCLYLLFS